MSFAVTYNLYIRSCKYWNNYYLNMYFHRKKKNFLEDLAYSCFASMILWEKQGDGGYFLLFFKRDSSWNYIISWICLRPCIIVLWDLISTDFGGRCIPLAIIILFVLLLINVLHTAMIKYEGLGLNSFCTICVCSYFFFKRYL